MHSRPLVPAVAEPARSAAGHRGVFSPGASRRQGYAAVLLMLVAGAVLPGAARAASSVYVANSGDRTIAQFDVGAGGELSPLEPATVATGASPQGVAVSPDGASVYVTDYEDATVSQFDVDARGGLSPKQPATVAAGANPAAIAMSSNGKSVYVTDYGADDISQFDVGGGGVLSPKEPATVATGQKPAGVAVSPDGRSVYVSNYGAASSSVSEFDVGVDGGLSPKDPAAIGGVETPAGVAVSPDGKSVYVTNFGAGDHRVSQFDVGADGVLTAKAAATVTTGTSPVAVAVSPDGTSVYVTNSGDDTVSQFDVDGGGALSAKLPATVSAGAYPYGIAISPDGGSVYVTDAEGDGVSLFDVGLGGALEAKIAGRVTTGASPFGIAVSRDRQPSGPPSARIVSPAEGATYSLGAGVLASYSCSPGANGGVLKPGAAGCSGSVPNGTAVDTATPGAHTFRAIATDTDGQTAAATSRYTVTQPPPRNVTPPSIVQSSSCPPVGRCRLIAHSYDCQSGSWEGRDAARPFLFTWWRLTPDRNYLGGFRPDKVATGETYRPSAGPLGALSQSWLFRCVVEAFNAGGSATATSRSATLDPLVERPQIVTNGSVDIRVTGIEVTQAIQAAQCACTGTLPSRDQASLNTPGEANYQGVKMAAGHFTVARVFANFTRPGAAKSLPGATAKLEIFDSNGDPLTMLTPDSSPPALSRPDCGLCVSAKERATPGASFNFLIPWQQTRHRALSFRATVIPPKGLTAPRQCSACKANRFDLVGVPFVSTAKVPIHPIPLTVGGVRTPLTESQVFASTTAVLPVDAEIYPYDAPLAVDKMNSKQAAAAVAVRASDDHLDGTQYPMGVFIDGTPNLGGLTVGGKVLYGAAPPISIVRDGRPLTSAMHEVGHGLGLEHADTGTQAGNPPMFTGPHPDGSADCGGNSNGQVGEAWPPDNKGRIQGIGLDRRKWDIFRTGSLPRTIVEGFPAVGDEFYDFMSYCSNTNETATASNRPDAWISVRNWNRLLDFHPPVQALPAAVRAFASGGVPLRVVATADAAGRASILDVTPGQRTAAKPTAASPYRVELRDRAGRSITSVVPATSFIHVDDRSPEPPARLLETTVPFARGVSAVVISTAGRELARRDRSAHTPTATIVRPKSGSRVGRTPTTLVRWKGADADGDRLTAAIDYSPDRGRHWKVVASDLRGRSATVPSRSLSASRHAQLRVRVSDGFDVATATASALRAVGAPPLVRITGGRGGRVSADKTLLLQGAAFDDTGRRLTGRRLRWYAAGRLVGRGEHLTARGLPVATRVIRLVATDARRRSSHAVLPLHAAPAPPAFRVIRAPTHVAPKARRVRIVVASTVPATLTIAGVRHRVGRKLRTITIRIRPGRSTQRLRYSLRSPGGTVSGTYIIKR